MNRVASRALATLLVLAGSLGTTAASAGSEACLAAYDDAQVQRKQGKLTEAREDLRRCSDSACPALVVSDCLRWLDEVQASLPSVVPIATDEAGANLAGLRVSVDGTPVKLPPGQAIELDPGTHHFLFEHDDLIRVEQDVLVAVGDRNKRVVVTMHAPVAVRATTGSAPAPRSSLVLVGLATGAVGLAGLAAGGILGALTIVKQSDAHCPNNVCGGGSNPGDLTTAKSDGNVSTGLFVAGGVLAAGGLTLWLLAPKGGATQSARLLPLLGSRGQGIVLVGDW